MLLLSVIFYLFNFFLIFIVFLFVFTKIYSIFLKKNCWMFFFFQFFGGMIFNMLNLNKNTKFVYSHPIFFSLFILIFFSNMFGLYIFISQNFLSKLSCSLLIMTLSCCIFSYLPFFLTKKEKFTLFLVGEMKFPSLSFLLSNIEILTQFFRPITLAARLWVNIWVGHLIMSAISLLFCFFLLKSLGVGFFCCLFLQGGFFLFELGIMSLQTFVFSYLVKVYFEENLHHSLMK